MSNAGDHLADGRQSFRLDQAVARIANLTDANQACAEGVRINWFQNVIVDSLSKSRNRSTQVGISRNDQNPGTRCGLADLRQEVLTGAVGQTMIEDKGEVLVPVLLPCLLDRRNGIDVVAIQFQNVMQIGLRVLIIFDNQQSRRGIYEHNESGNRLPLC